MALRKSKSTVIDELRLLARDPLKFNPETGYELILTKEQFDSVQEEYDRI